MLKPLHYAVYLSSSLVAAKAQSSAEQKYNIPHLPREKLVSQLAYLFCCTRA